MTDTAPAPALLPCPFCGEAPLMNCEPPESADGYFVACASDRCPSNVNEWLWAMTMDQARDQWNRRSAPEARSPASIYQATEANGLLKVGGEGTAEPSSASGAQPPDREELLRRTGRADDLDRLQLCQLVDDLAAALRLQPDAPQQGEPAKPTRLWAKPKPGYPDSVSCVHGVRADKPCAQCAAPQPPAPQPDDTNDRWDCKHCEAGRIHASRSHCPECDEPRWDGSPAIQPRQATPQPDTGALQLAIKFHETYERLAPSFGYETRKETRAFDPATPNGKLMVAVCGEMQAALRAAPQAPPGWRMVPLKAGLYDLKDFREAFRQLGYFDLEPENVEHFYATLIAAAPPLGVEQAPIQAVGRALDSNNSGNARSPSEPVPSTGEKK